MAASSSCSPRTSAIAASSVAVGFAAGWIAARSQQPPTVIIHQHAAPSIAAESPSPSSSSSAASASLIERIYPLHSAASSWRSVSLANHKVLLVTGPQRSGTTWAACALASQYGFALFDERHPITSGNDTLVALRRAFAFAREQPIGSVIQSPMATSILHQLPIFPGLAVVFLARNCLDVFRSQNRVMPNRGGWTCVAGRTKELRKYRTRPELTPHFDERDMLCTIKQHVWMRYQRPLLERRAAEEQSSYAGAGLPLAATIDFDSFRTHPLWQGAEKRTNLTIKRAAGVCAKVQRASTPLRSKRRVKEWTELADAAERRAREREAT